MYIAATLCEKYKKILVYSNTILNSLLMFNDLGEELQDIKYFLCNIVSNCTTPLNLIPDCEADFEGSTTRTLEIDAREGHKRVGELWKGVLRTKDNLNFRATSTAIAPL